MTTARLSTLLLLCVALLAGCGNETDKSTVGGALATKAKGILAARAAKGKSPAAVTRAAVEEYGKPLMRVKIASRGMNQLLTLRDTRDDISTWTTTGGTTFTFRDGVLIETRGLGHDLMSSLAPSPTALAAFGQEYTHSYYVLGPNSATQRRRYGCTTASLGSEVIEIIERAHSVLHVQETCTRSEGKLTSDYWLEGASIRKSRQWVSPSIGYAEFERVID